MSIESSPNAEYLIQRYLDNSILAHEMEQLNSLLMRDARVRRRFTDYMSLDSLIAETACGVPGTQAAVEDIVELNRQSLANSRLTYGLLSVAAALTLVASCWWYVSGQPYATVVRSIGIGSLPDGTPLRNEFHSVSAGMLECVTVLGARVVIEAPAEFCFESAHRLNMRAGRLTADVPSSAKGFTVITPAGQAIDLGTKFAIDISGPTEAEVHVFEGEVITQPKGSSQRHLLTASKAVRLGGRLPTEACDVRQGAFVREREVSAIAEAFRSGQRERALAARNRLKEDPHLLAWLDFDEPQLVRTELPDAQVLGARWVQGRFPGSGALDFVNSEDCVKLDLNSQLTAFTLMTWVRLNQLEGRRNSLYSTDEWGDLGQVHWMIGESGNIRFAIKGEQKSVRGDTNVWLESQPRLVSELQRWVHLALVYDASTGAATQYFDGEAIATAAMPLDLPASLGPAQLGNWKPKAELVDQPRRRLSGRMDEFAAWARPLSAQEIRDYFEASTPYK